MVKRFFNWVKLKFHCAFNKLSTEDAQTLRFIIFVLFILLLLLFLSCSEQNKPSPAIPVNTSSARLAAPVNYCGLKLFTVNKGTVYLFNRFLNDSTDLPVCLYTVEDRRVYLRLNPVQEPVRLKFYIATSGPYWFVNWYLYSMNDCYDLNLVASNQSDSSFVINGYDVTGMWNIYGAFPGNCANLWHSPVSEPVTLNPGSRYIICVEDNYNTVNRFWFKYKYSL